MRRNISVGKTSLSALFVLALTLLLARPAAAENRWGPGYFPNVPLTTQDGKVVHFYDDMLKGKIVVIDLIYTHCVDACPLETARLAQVQKMLGDRVGKDIFFYSISIDPRRDTPAALKAYAQKFHVGPGWTFLTGKKSDITLISQKLGLYTDPDPEDRDGHTPEVLLGNEPTGQWIKNSALDNPRFLAIMIGDWLNSWKNASVAPANNYAEAPVIDIKERGRYLFGSHCSACHTIGHGDKIGPDLAGVTKNRDPQWLARFISTPEKMVAEKDPIATALFAKYNQVNMPNLRLEPSDLRDLINFLHQQSEAQEKNAASVSKAAPAPAEAGSSSSNR